MRQTRDGVMRAMGVEETPMHKATVVLVFAMATLGLRVVANPAVIHCADGSRTQQLAAREVRRYVYQRTGTLLPVTADALPDGNAIVLRLDASLEQQQYALETTTTGARKVLTIKGGDDVAVLYGAYRFAETLGVRFFLHGDVIPDAHIPFVIPDLNETHMPLFELRGLNPWGSHPFGFDLWNTDDWIAHIGQMAKMRMNFIGMHCYPEGRPYAEPTVWLGLEGDFDDRGHVHHSYPSRFYNTLFKTRWGAFVPGHTGDYRLGASHLFERDDWGPDVMADFAPQPVTPEACSALFNRTGEMFRDAFTFARLVGVKTCLGTEAPLRMPADLQQRLKRQGRDPTDPSVVREVYEGIFTRIRQTHPLDYYWIWTEESWTWSGNKPEQYRQVIDDIKLAHEALANVGSPFTLATAGWVLGPKDDRAALDRDLPEDIALSAISRTVGHSPIDQAFGDVKRQGKWAIPWMEDDTALSSPQLWVGRTRKDAADALAYGCTGLMGLIWRTRILGPNIAALAQAGWNQRTWNPTPGECPEPGALRQPTPLLGHAFPGNTASYPGKPIAGTEDDELYRTCRYDLGILTLNVPDGRYRVTLKFCEPHFSAVGKRVCDIKLQGKTVIEALDIFKEVGSFAALDNTFDDVSVSNGVLQVELVYRESLPCISALVIENKSFAKRVNLAGPAFKDYESDLNTAVTAIARGTPRGHLNSADFYADWACAMFGGEAANRIGSLFTRLDGCVPRAGAGGCPARLKADARPWSNVAPEYRFVDELRSLGPTVHGAGSRDRLAYWLNTFEYLRAMARLECAMGAFSRQRSAEAALPAFRELVTAYRHAYESLLAGVCTQGGLATLCFWEHVHYPASIGAARQRLATLTGKPLLEDLALPPAYSGQPRLIVPTVRTQVRSGEALTLKVIVLDNEQPARAILHWRPMGTGAYRVIALRHKARGVYTVTLPPAEGLAIETYIQVTAANGLLLTWPAAAPAINHVLTVMP